MIDVQSRHDDRGIALDEAGISDLRYPIFVLDRTRERQATIATLSMAVGLPQHFKGTHMSRFIEILEEHRGEITLRTLPTILAALRERLSAASARMTVRFPYFLERRAPVSRARSLMDYQCSFTASTSTVSDEMTLGVIVPVTSLCPCSKEISDYGAHNQRGFISIDAGLSPAARSPQSWLWLEELIDVAESSASSPIYPLLKRPDERHVTMQAFENPVFVEDMVRNVALRLKDDTRITWFRVHARNEESIHNHSAFAALSWPPAVAEAGGRP